MIGIVDYTTYISRYRLRRDLIAEQWRSKSLGGMKAVANFDEDALTLGYQATWALVQRANAGVQVDGLYFASTTSPHWQRASSSFIAAACDLPDEVETVEFGGTLRAGTSALRAAFNALAAGANRHVIVTSADVRDGAPESPEEQFLGDAAAAIAIGSESVVAELVAHATRSDDFMDEWRRDRDRYVTVLSSRYSIDRGYLANVVSVGRRVLELAGVKPAEVAGVALSSPDGRAHGSAGKKLGFVPEQLVDVPVKEIGITGAAMPLWLLCAALDRAEPGALVLVIGHGDGADALLFRVTDEHRRRKPHSADMPTLEIPSYSVYRKLREFTRSGLEEGAIISNVSFEKEERQNVRLHATRCSNCQTVQFPLTHVCVKCRNRDSLREVPMARRGVVFTYTKDYLYPAPSLPTVMAVVELEDGARFYCQMTDVDAETVAIGQPVELTLRRMKEGGGMHHYYWKCRPV